MGRLPRSVGLHPLLVARAAQDVRERVVSLMTGVLEDLLVVLPPGNFSAPHLRVGPWVVNLNV